MFQLKHFQRCRHQKPRTAFFFRVVQYLFIDTIEQITGQCDVELLRLARGLGDIDVQPAY